MRPASVVLFSNVCSPHQLLLKVLDECVFAATYDELFIVGFAHCYFCCLIATFVAPVEGNQIIAATTVDLDSNLCAVAYHERSCTETVWGNGSEY